MKLDTHTFNVIDQILKSRMFSPHDLKQVATIANYLYSVKEDKVADWILAHKIEYLTGLLEGFEVDNSQKNQLRDIHTRINL